MKAVVLTPTRALKSSGDIFKRCILSGLVSTYSDLEIHIF